LPLQFIFMGVSLTEIIEPRETEFEQLHGRCVAVDAYNTLYQFLSIIRDRMTGEPLRDSRGRVTSHLSGLFYRTSRMLEAGIEPVYVFDGKPPEFKEETVAARKETREEAEARWKQAVKEGDAEAVRRYSQQASKLTDEMLEDSKRLLGLMGVSWLQAPSEGEAQAAHLLKKGRVWAVGSQDWDSLLFGAERLVRNLTVSGRRKLPKRESYVTVKPEMIELKPLLTRLGISQEQLIILGILVGTDYNQGGVRGIGPKKALQLVREHRTLEAVLREVPWDFPTPAERIFDFFMNPPVENLEIEPRTLDIAGLRTLLIEGHDFSPERVDSTLKRLGEASEKGKQSSLGSFLGR
jgi:flap endonuclease-1